MFTAVFNLQVFDDFDMVVTAPSCWGELSFCRGVRMPQYWGRPTRPGEECQQECADDGAAACGWCGGSDWFCCSATQGYSATDNCAGVNF